MQYYFSYTNCTIPIYIHIGLLQGEHVLYVVYGQSWGECFIMYGPTFLALGLQRPKIPSGSVRLVRPDQRRPVRYRFSFSFL